MPKKTKRPKTELREFRIVDDDDGHLYVIGTDECAVFDKWMSAMKGQRHFPANFTPIQIDGLHTLRFREWREEHI